MIYYTQLSVGSLIRLKYDDISDNSFNTGKRGRLEELRIESTAPIKQILERRRKRYPDDIYVFQSHSNHVPPRQVTVIAFNAALRKAGATRPGLPVSSSSAKYITG
jgi:integrase